MSDLDPALRTRRWRQLWLLYGITLLVTAGLTWLQGSVAWIRGYTLVIVAATFLYLPIEVLHRGGEDPADLGIHRKSLMRALAFAALVMAVTFPPYLLAFHGWQTQVVGNAPAAEVRVERWPVELQDPPRVAQLVEGEVRLYTADRKVWLRWKLPLGQRFEATVVGDRLMPGVGPIRLDEGRLTIEAGSEGVVTFTPDGDTFSVAVDAGGDRLPPGRLRLGTATVRAEENPYRAERTPWWLLNLILVQLLLVALPEEVFYRGFLQSRLDGLIGRDVKIFGVMVNPASLLLTSALFAIGHYVTIPSVQRLAVFFPSLLFGWMRRATGGVVAPTLYHAACNILVEVALLYYD